MINHKRIAKNTLVLYLRMVVTMGISLYTVRVVLDALGVEDYGIYHVTGGLVALLSFLPGSMASATQRFFAYALGQGEEEKLKMIFGVNGVIYAAIAIFAFLCLESVGVWFLGEYLKIPEGRQEAALQLYHLSVLAFIVGIFTTPFRAIIIAHEDMHIYAFIAIGEAVLRVALVYSLAVSQGDRMVTYGFLMLLLSVMSVSTYTFICFRRYAECQIKIFRWDWELAFEISGFTWWTLFGQVTNIARKQAVTILLNQFFNPATVAARVVALKVASSGNFLAHNLNLGLYPPIIKSYAAGDKNRMFSLIFNGSKLTFFLMWILALPLMLEMETILAIWLKEPPSGAALFARLALVEALIIAISLPLATAARAPGKMAVYEGVLGTIQIAIFAAAWIVLHFGGAAYLVFVVAIVANLLMFFVRLLLLRKLIEISATDFFRRVAVPVIEVVMFSAVLSLVAKHLLPDGWLFSILSGVGAMLLVAFGAFFIGMDKAMRGQIVESIRTRIPTLAK